MTSPLITRAEELAALNHDALVLLALSLEQDARRYRWLRDKSPGQYEQPIVVTQARAGDHMKYIGPLAYDNLDAAIDQAISAAP